MHKDKTDRVHDAWEKGVRKLGPYIKCLKEQLKLVQQQEVDVLKRADIFRYTPNAVRKFSYLECFNRLHAKGLALYCEIRDLGGYGKRR